MFSKLNKQAHLELYPASKNATVTLATGMDFCNKLEFWTYVNSLKNTNADHYILTYEMNISHRNRLEDQKCIVIDVDRYYKTAHSKTNSNFFISRNMAYAFFSFILCDRLYEKVAITDSKDVIFQRDVFEIIPKDTGTTSFERKAPELMMMTTEGILHKDSPWNLMDQFNFHSKVNEEGKQYIKPDNVMNKPIINGGVILGTPYKLFHELSMFNSIERQCTSVDGFTDQAVWNHYIHTNTIQCKISDPRTDNVCITGEAIKEGFADDYYRFENNKFLTNNGEMYYIVHQWDRTKHRGNILND